MKDYTLKVHTIDGCSAISFPYFGIYVRDAAIINGEVKYPHRVRRKAGKTVLDASGNPVKDAVYHPMGAFKNEFEDWLRDVVRTGRCSTIDLDAPDVYAYVTPRNFGSDLLAFVCLNYRGLIIDDIALKKDASGNLLLTMPHRSIVGPDGTRHPVDLVEISDPNEYNRIMDLILDKYQIG